MKTNLLSNLGLHSPVLIHSLAQLTSLESTSLSDSLHSLSSLIQRPYLLLHERWLPNYLFKPLFKLNSANKHPLFEAVLHHFLQLEPGKADSIAAKGLAAMNQSWRSESVEDSQNLPLPICLLILQMNLKAGRSQLSKDALADWLLTLLAVKFDPQYLISHIELISLCLLHKKVSPGFFALWREIQSELDGMNSINPDILAALLGFVKIFQSQFLFESDQFAEAEKIFEIGFAVKKFVDEKLAYLGEIESWASDHWNFNPVSLSRLSSLAEFSESNKDMLNKKILECFEDPVYFR